MRITFVLGPAGSGKTFRCLSEIRNELIRSPEGAPLIFLAPKQSTYQLERQLLADGLAGYTRLQIVSFERFARFIFQEMGAAIPKFLSEQGRTMVLRALLTEIEGELSIFRGASRRQGFAEEVSRQLREFHNHGLSPIGVRKLAESVKLEHHAREKLLDLALIFERYLHWLEDQELEDGDALLTAATELLERQNDPQIEFAGIWFDGFAQLTPQELKLLVAALRFARKGTLAFCVEPESAVSSKISTGYLVGQTVARCRAHMEQRFGHDAVHIDGLRRDPQRTRFQGSAALKHLERCWQTMEEYGGEADGAVRVVRANDPEAEVIFVAREIVRHVRSGGRYRDVALLLRDLGNDYPHVLRRAFLRYGIPFFLDHRESVAHHPAAELTRGALRTVVYSFQHDDWFGTLKCGLVRAAAEQIDELENEALARGWQGSVWRDGFKLPEKYTSLEDKLNKLRQKLVSPFVAFANALGERPSADELVAGIRGLWESLKVQEQLEGWSQEDAGAAKHATVWEQMELWLEDLKLAFRGQQKPLVDWLPIIEAGLKNLSVGVVPPVLDQVLIGTVDRSRNPNLRTVYVLGVNERMFPAAVTRDRLLTEDDRQALCDTGCSMGETPAWRLAGEQFYGYIACTRPRERLILSYARSSMDGGQLNPSRFVSQVKRIFPQLEEESFELPGTVAEVVHQCELAALGLGDESTSALGLPDIDEQLDSDLARRLYGNELRISVSSLERFASCPYKFFLEHGLKVRERKEFLLDVREQGSFQHEVLSRFHEELKGEGLKWRDLTTTQARERVARIADNVIPKFGDGLLASTEQNRFTAEHYKRTLQDLMAVLVEWLTTNRFDPELVEFGFGKDGSVPGWKVPLGNGFSLLLQGRVDRVDILRRPNGDALCVVMDYKSGLKQPNRTLLHHGIQQQLPAYLLMMSRVQEVAAHLKVEKISPAGCFLLPLKGKPGAQKNRRKALEGAAELNRLGYTHEGIYDVEHLGFLDTKAPDDSSGQFRHRITKSSAPHKGSFNALKSDEFEAILRRTEEIIRETGRRIFAGDISIWPYKLGTKSACEHCDYQAVCRFDSWVQKHRVLQRPGKGELE